MLRLVFVIVVCNISVSVTWAQGLVEPPIIEIVNNSIYSLTTSYYDDKVVVVETRVYDHPNDAGFVILNTIHIRNEEKGYGALIYEFIHEDKYVRSFNFNRSQLYFIFVDKFPDGKEAILVYRKKDSQLIAVIGKKESGAWDTENNENLNKLVRKYNPEIK